MRPRAGAHRDNSVSFDSLPLILTRTERIAVAGAVQLRMTSFSIS